MPELAVPVVLGISWLHDTRPVIDWESYIMQIMQGARVFEISSTGDTIAVS